jgi:dolichol kinase
MRKIPRAPKVPNNSQTGLAWLVWMLEIGDALAALLMPLCVRIGCGSSEQQTTATGSWGDFAVLALAAFFFLISNGSPWSIGLLSSTSLSAAEPVPHLIHAALVSLAAWYLEWEANWKAALLPAERAILAHSFGLLLRHTGRSRLALFFALAAGASILRLGRQGASFFALLWRRVTLLVALAALTLRTEDISGLARLALASGPLLWLWPAGLMLCALPLVGKIELWGGEGVSAGRNNLRKFYHICAVAMFLPALILQQHRLLSVALSVAALLFVNVEMARLEAGKSPLDSFMERCRCERLDRAELVLSHLWLLLGCALPVWMSASDSDLIPASSGIVALGIGDALASVVGGSLGRWKWPRSHKTVEGTMAAFIGMTAAWTLIAPEKGLEIWKVAAAAAGFEAICRVNDNLALPLFTLFSFRLFKV